MSAGNTLKESRNPLIPRRANSSSERDIGSHHHYAEVHEFARNDIMNVSQDDVVEFSFHRNSLRIASIQTVAESLRLGRYSRRTRILSTSIHSGGIRSKRDSNSLSVIASRAP